MQRLYFVACLQTLTGVADVAPRVLAVHVRLLSADAEQLGKAVRRARKYTEQSSGDAELWLARLDAERLAGVGDDAVTRGWAEARRRVSAGPGREQVWLWGLGVGGDVRTACEVRDGHFAAR